MKYVSVWSNGNDGNEMNNSKKCNQWIPFTDNQNNPIHFGEYYDNYGRLRALNGGSNNHLLFITYKSKDISVFDLNTFQFIKHNTIVLRWRDASHLSNNEIKLIIQYWNRILKIKLGWIDELDKIVIKYDRMKNSVYDIYKSLKIISFFYSLKKKKFTFKCYCKKIHKKKKSNCFRL
ncbi:hypothetical protein RFI_00615 [Reticulomyxa filosa]|uniref:Uncharacterized protein n=1 Tax=Reticulomyxa filosa TaxID=46433 RepID=X6PEC4_RETFI|nr:hypothetical protein RFI_00615 [Reticulomyxa filosa]|eukprot:ETO36448.1 hypothetical protein RFI_00615 [Reticulomyxa filosa]